MKNIKIKIIYSELLTTDALVNSIRVLFILKTITEADFIGYLNTFMLCSSFIFEIPSGYLGDKYGNKRVVIFSKVIFILSIISLIIDSSSICFILSFIFLGIYSALESGAKNSYFLELFHNDADEYKKLRLKVEKYKYAISFVFSVSSSVLFYLNMYIPFIITALIGLVSLIITIFLPKEKSKKNETSMLFSAKTILIDIIKNRSFLIRIFIFTILSTVTIYTFYYYNFFFIKSGVPEYLFGLIYSSFSLLGIIGIKLYQNKKIKKLSIFLKLLLPFSFLFVISNNIILLAFAIFIQEVLISYISVEFGLELITEMNGRKDSSQFESTISFFYSAIRLMLTGILTALISKLGIDYIFIMITIVSSFVILYQLFNYSYRKRKC